MSQSTVIETTEELLFSEKELFQWSKQWYPIAVVEFLDPTRPHGIQLLGKDLTLWRDGTGKWRCFEDACPHRLAPLSEGRVEADGTLLCAYHAWRFDGSGTCQHIPQSKDPQTDARNCANPKANATAYPTQECQGLLWVWAEAGEQAQKESQLRSPRLIPELEPGVAKVEKKFWNIRDLPYSWDFFIENVSDPAHVPVSHHGLVGNRYRDAQYYDMPRLRDISTQEGFAFGVTTTVPTIEQTAHDFQPPCLMKITTTFKDGGQLLLILYATPTKPGWCRHIGCQVLIKNALGKVPSGLAFFALPMPTWAGHILASLFLHQDLVFLHAQEQAFMSQGEGNWLEHVYTPNPQDKMVIAFRQWLQKRAGGAIPYAGKYHHAAPQPLSRTQLFDVWDTHTSKCLLCQNALKRIRRLEGLAYAVAIVCFGAGVMLDARDIALNATLASSTAASAFSLPPLSVIGLLLLACFGGATGYLLRRFGRLFFSYEFDHSKND
ncbi:MAG: Rieske 2Fe-2S domain-containing protein [Leptolyngbya sp. BL-A-14]